MCLGSNNYIYEAKRFENKITQFYEKEISQFD